MPTLTIRNLPDHVHAALRSQALQYGLTVEAEVRKTLTDAFMMDRKQMIVLDASALLAYLFRESGHEIKEKSNE
jgi:plasmid stability protein